MHPPPQGPPGFPPQAPAPPYATGYPGHPPAASMHPGPHAAAPHVPVPQAAPPPFPPPAPTKPKKEGGGAWVLIVDKAIDFALIFVGLYAATSLQRWQDARKEKQEYVALLGDFKRELAANLEQEASIEKDLGEIEETEPGKNLGPMQETFHHFFAELREDEKIVQCMHDEFLVEHNVDETAGEVAPAADPKCHVLYAQFDKSHGEHEASFSFEPAALTPFYRREVWQLYLADGVKTFRNKELAVQIGEVYANARLIEDQIEDIEETYNAAFMPQVGRTAATDMELAEVVHDEETQHGLSAADRTLLVHVDEAIKGEHYAALEVERTLELKAQRMKNTVLLMRSEIETVQKAIDDELAKHGEK